MICSGVCRLLLIADLLAESPTSSDPNIRSGLLSGGHATFPGTEGRLRFPLVVDTDAADVERTLGTGLRWFHFLGPLDLGVSSFYGTSREPRFMALGPASAPTGFAPVYERVFQFGVDAQLTHEAWL
jgi:hypothetical protein